MFIGRATATAVAMSAVIVFSSYPGSVYADVLHDTDSTFPQTARNTRGGKGSSRKGNGNTKSRKDTSKSSSVKAELEFCRDYFTPDGISPQDEVELTENIEAYAARAGIDLTAEITDAENALVEEEEQTIIKAYGSVDSYVTYLFNKVPQIYPSTIDSSSSSDSGSTDAKVSFFQAFIVTWIEVEFKYGGKTYKYSGKAWGPAFGVSEGRGTISFKAGVLDRIKDYNRVFFLSASFVAGLSAATFKRKPEDSPEDLIWKGLTIGAGAGLALNTGGEWTVS